MDSLRSNETVQQILGQTDDDVKESEEINVGELNVCVPDGSLDADTWVKAAEFVPGQLWQSVGK